MTSPQALLQQFLDDVTSPEVTLEMMKEIKLARGMCITYYAKLVHFIQRLPEETRREYKINIYSGVMESLLMIINNSMDSALLLKNMSKIKNILSICYPSLTTLRSYLSHMKSNIIYRFENFPEVVNAAKKIFCLSMEDYKELDKKYNQLVIDRNKNQETLSDLLVIKIIHDLKESLKWEEQMIAIALSCGSRMIEIAKISNYEPCGGEPFQVVIHGVAKSKERVVTIKKPVVGGLRASEIVHLVRQVRLKLHSDFSSTTELLDIDNKVLTRYISSKVDKYVKQQLGPFVEGKLCFHTLRSIYAEMAWVESQGTHTMSKTAYYAEVLGHNPTDIKTALSYQRFVVKPGLEVKEVKKPVTYTDNVMRSKKSKQKANFKGKNGWFTIEKKKNSKRMESLEADAKTLLENGIKLSYDNLRRCGYGSELIKKWKRKKKDKETQENQAVY